MASALKYGHAMWVAMGTMRRICSAGKPVRRGRASTIRSRANRTERRKEERQSRDEARKSVETNSDPATARVLAENASLRATLTAYERKFGSLRLLLDRLRCDLLIVAEMTGDAAFSAEFTQGAPSGVANALRSARAPWKPMSTGPSVVHCASTTPMPVSNAAGKVPALVSSVGIDKLLAAPVWVPQKTVVGTSISGAKGESKSNIGEGTEATWMDWTETSQQLAFSDGQ